MVLDRIYVLKGKKGKRIEYKCPCGKGMIVEEYGRVKRVYIDCPACEAKYYLSTPHGAGHWTVQKRVPA